MWDLLNEKEKEKRPNCQESWGGRATIGGSPRSEGSHLEIDDILEFIYNF